MVKHHNAVEILIDTVFLSGYESHYYKHHLVAGILTPFPAIDYTERHFDLNYLLMPKRNNVILILIPDGFVLAGKSMKPVNGDTVVFQMGECPQHGRLFRTGIITLDGETIDEKGWKGLSCWGRSRTR
ncbi:hypothetical protein [Pantoea sp. JKS000250]|uniref:hypothetical protein n=1 Tax=Pantoea sp. JKS000250 TaxID=1938795 RepID=UPI002B4086D1|nr:hypothetical protein [Pantoea sp. JKS000250]